MGGMLLHMKINGIPYNNSQLKNRYGALRKQYAQVVFVKNLSGASALHPYLPEESWNRLIAGDDTYSWIRDLPEEWTFMQEMDRLCGSRAVSGKNILSPEQILTSCVNTAYPYASPTASSDSMLDAATVDDEVTLAQTMYRQSLKHATPSSEDSLDASDVSSSIKRIAGCRPRKSNAAIVEISSKLSAVAAAVESATSVTWQRDMTINALAKWLESELAHGKLSLPQVMQAEKFSARFMQLLMQMQEETRRDLMRGSFHDGVVSR